MTKEALKLALEALEAVAIQGDVACVVTNDGEIYLKPVITAIKEALAQPEPWEKFCDSNCVWTDHHPDCKLAEQEPVAFMFQHDEVGRCVFSPNDSKDPVGTFLQLNPRYHLVGPLYTTQPQRKPLTDEEIADLWGAQIFHVTDLKLAIDFVRDIERAHGIKGKS